MDIVAEIDALESESRQLEPSPAMREHVRDKVILYTEGFLNRIEELHTYHTTKSQGAGILDHPITEDPMPIEELITLVEDEVDTPGLNPASGGHLGYIPGGGIYYSALADYMADVSNRYAGVFFASPGAVRIENLLIDWMRKMVGYPESAAGNLTSGGSIANLIAIVSARQAADLKGADLERTVIYASAHMHHCLNKAIRIAGLGECKLHYLDLDEEHRIKPASLAEAIEKDKQDGLRPWLVIASAGTTDTGAIDPLDPIADLCDENELWFHVDGAYGAFFMLCEETRGKLKGIERSHSVVMDPHKGLFLPYGSGVVIVRDRRPMLQAHAYQANYMQDTLSFDEELSPADLSPELTKHFRGLRLWLPLKLHGLGPFRACLQEKLLLARYFRAQLATIPNMERGPEPELSVVTFRYLPSEGDPNSFNAALVEAVRTDGRVFLSSTLLDGKFIIRFAALSFRTHRSTVDLCLDILRKKILLLENNK